MFYVIAAVLGVLAVVVYFAGVRSGKAWGTPLLVLLILGAVVVTILPLTSLRQRAQLRDWEKAHVTRLETIGEMLGQELASELSPGAKVLIIGTASDSEVKRGLERGAGFEVSIVDSVILTAGEREPGYNMPSARIPHTAASFNATIHPYENDDLDLIISTIGMPAYDEAAPAYELERLSCFDWAKAPMFATDVGGRFNADMLREYIRQGLLSAVLIRAIPGGDRTAIGADNVDDIP